MSTKHRMGLIASTAFAVATAGLVATAHAQPGPGSGHMGPGMMGPGLMMGPGMMGRGMMGRMCGPGAAGFSEWRISRIEQIVKPTAEQKTKLDDLKTASDKAAELMRGACPTDLPGNMPGRMEAMEKRADAMLQAIKTMRPALDAFYASLTDEQKTRLDGYAGRGRFRRWYWHGRP